MDHVLQLPGGKEDRLYKGVEVKKMQINISVYFIFEKAGRTFSDNNLLVLE
jgi:hypothetical protein